MKHRLFAATAALALTAPSVAQQAPPPVTEIPSPGEIAAAAPASDWIAIPVSDLLVMDLAPTGNAKEAPPRRVVIQLMPAPFSQGWIGNIRKLAAAHWWDGTSVNRVQDNYVVQWGDATEKKALPEGLAAVPESDYETEQSSRMIASETGGQIYVAEPKIDQLAGPFAPKVASAKVPRFEGYPYATGFVSGWPIAGDVRLPPFGRSAIWPVHCYGMVGVGRNLSPDTGSGAELYTVIGQAPRHLDRNIAVVGRVIGGIEHLSSLPRGTGALGFYEDEKERVPIASIRLATELPAADQPRFEYLSTDSKAFERYADARANRRDPFFIKPAGGADICNIPVPVRAVAGSQ